MVGDVDLRKVSQTKRFDIMNQMSQAYKKWLKQAHEEQEDAKCTFNPFISPKQSTAMKSVRHGAVNPSQ